MNKNLTWKLAVIGGVLLIFLFGIFGVPSNWTPKGLVAAITEHIHLGLDLRGGTHLILQVQVNDAVNVETDNVIARLREDMRSHKINYVEITKPDPDNHPETVVVKGVPQDQLGEFKTLAVDRLPDYDVTSGAENSFSISMKGQSLSELKDRAVQQAIETINNRVDALGVNEHVIEPHGLGKYQILMQLPGVDDPVRVKEVIKSTAMLEIKQSLGGPYPSHDAALQDKGGVAPEGSILMPGKIGIRGSSDAGESWYFISRAAAVSGRDLRTAEPTRDENGQPAVRFILTGDGGRKFYSFTSAHVGDYLAVVLDGKVQQVAVIKEAIRDTGVIEGHFTDQQVQDTAMTLRSGALPASIKYLEERTVGPSLGADSIKSGMQAAMAGMLAVLVFMLVYYRWAGVNANVALIFNLVILLGFMGFFGASLTLPGIAGVILTVGMGVDSNVLIFERIREELRNGKTPPSAVEQGFAHAWITIVDTHVTTIVSAAILFIFGTGPVKGFATTLVFGLLANLFTAVFVSRVIFDWVLGRKQRGEALSI
jgi:preprotein translocase subunit SecD